MKVIVTAGGTVEPIDDVRSISNNSTGRMGITIANYLLQQNVEVIFVASKNIQQFLVNDSKLLHRVTITDVNSVMQSLENILIKEKITAVIHSMAVSDYNVYGVCAGEQIETIFSSPEVNYVHFINQFQSMTNQKLNSSHDELYLRLTQAPKIIRYIKKWQPETLLIGFRLLVNADDKQFEEATIKQQNLANSDYVVANDLQDIQGDQHLTTIYNQGKVVKKNKTREELAQTLWKLIQSDRRELR